jgi:hypothetical protein
MSGSRGSWGGDMACGGNGLADGVRNGATSMMTAVAVNNRSVMEMRREEKEESRRWVERVVPSGPKAQAQALLHAGAEPTRSKHGHHPRRQAEERQSSQGGSERVSLALARSRHHHCCRRCRRLLPARCERDSSLSNRSEAQPVVPDVEEKEEVDDARRSPAPLRASGQRPAR